jgi:D-alanyl-D-alanine carboxypeptidase/D-alanyl-D-alanine-endopeptidase (penicillin-binding protein 4)
MKLLSQIMAGAAALSLLALGCATGAGERAAREALSPALPADSSLLRLERFRLMADSLLADSLLEGANCGVYIVELDSGREIYTRNHESLLIPASVNKLFVAAAALKAFGLHHRFRTAVCGDTQQMVQGVLKGNLYLKGYGNPDLKKSDLEALAFRLRASGLRRIIGDLVADPSYFDTTSFGYGWMWDEGPYAYNAPVSALSLDKNTFELGVRPGAL